MFLQHVVKSVEILASHPSPVKERLVKGGSEFMADWQSKELPAAEKKEFDRIVGVLTAFGRIDQTVPEMADHSASEVARDICKLCRVIDLLD